MIFRFFLSILFLLASISALKADSRISETKLPYKNGELIVTFKHRNSSKTVHRNVGSLVKSSLRELKSDLVILPETLSIKEAIQKYQDNPEVAYAEPNYIVHKATLPNDPLFSSQWNMQQISAPEAWNNYVGSNSSNSKIVAILDTGVDYNHPDLAANIWFNSKEIKDNGIDDDGNGIVDDYYGVNYNNGTATSGNPLDDDSADAHGTHISGIIGAVGNNNIGVAGLNWKTRIMPVKVLHGREGYGEAIDILKGIEYAVSKGASVINCSIEYPEVDEFGNQITEAELKSFRDAMQYADINGVLVVTAAGNRGKNLNIYNSFPASIQTNNNIAVGASSSNDNFASYSDFGNQIVSVAAPGGDAYNVSGAILSTVSNLTNDYGVPLLLLYRTTAGTSMAAPHVSGLAALIWNMHPDLTHYQVKARIMNSVDKLDAFSRKVITNGRINAARALEITDLPAIFSISPRRAISDTTINITGANFGLSKGAISLAGEPLMILSWSDTQITATLPKNSHSGEISVNGLGTSYYMAIPETPYVSLNVDPTNGKIPLDVTFQGSIHGTDVNIISYEWDLGDGIFTTLSGITDKLDHTFTLTGTYSVRLRITDDMNRTAISSTTVYAGTAPPSASTQGSSGGGCFIATAAWGSPLHPRVMVLRHFRDKHLLNNIPGRLFVKYYYAVSPPIAEFISRHTWLKSMVRVFLNPIVSFAEWLEN